MRLLLSLRKALRDTLVGGIVFLLPFLLALLLIDQAVGLSRQLLRPVGYLVPAARDLDSLGQLLLTLVGLLLLALLAGMFVRTRPGQRLFGWVEGSMLAALPRFAATRRVVERLGDDIDDVRVVLVPSDGGKALGFAFETEVDGWVPVFLPGAPDWHSGSVLFVAAADLSWLDLEPEAATRFLSRLDGGEDLILNELRQLRLRPRAG